MSKTRKYLDKSVELLDRASMKLWAKAYERHPKLTVASTMFGLGTLGYFAGGVAYGDISLPELYGHPSYTDVTEQAAAEFYLWNDGRFVGGLAGAILPTWLLVRVNDRLAAYRKPKFDR